MEIKINEFRYRESLLTGRATRANRPLSIDEEMSVGKKTCARQHKRGEKGFSPCNRGYTVTRTLFVSSRSKRGDVVSHHVKTTPVYRPTSLSRSPFVKCLRRLNARIVSGPSAPTPRRPNETTLRVSVDTVTFPSFLLRRRLI